VEVIPLPFEASILSCNIHTSWYKKTYSSSTSELETAAQKRKLIRLKWTIRPGTHLYFLIASVVGEELVHPQLITRV